MQTALAAAEKQNGARPEFPSDVFPPYCTQCNTCISCTVHVNIRYAKIHGTDHRP
jgi:hypothetical protein